jgi:hypothetical protein
MVRHAQTLSAARGRLGNFTSEGLGSLQHPRHIAGCQSRRIPLRAHARRPGLRFRHGNGVLALPRQSRSPAQAPSARVWIVTSHASSGNLPSGGCRRGRRPTSRRELPVIGRAVLKAAAGLPDEAVSRFNTTMERRKEPDHAIGSPSSLHAANPRTVGRRQFRVGTAVGPPRFQVGCRPPFWMRRDGPWAR